MDGRSRRVAGQGERGQGRHGRHHLTLAEDDLVALVKGTAAADLYQRGSCASTATCAPAHRLAIFKGLA